ncbi:rhomboid family intramembrane serine protease [Gordonia zhaorongruii]|uniref:rhomboid family intramembrane serine protease n=1 Tax=Gordonia zhaorongruii TaxID=2597659 RepID=UPI001F27966A|nr:rhomboid family intramembrane serine protease [Gordonia zhaorongruii]
MNRAPAGPSAASSRSRWGRAAIIIGVVVVVLLAIEVVDLILNGRLDRLGIVPREWSGLSGIVWAPLLHADLAHLVANLLPGVVLAFFVLLSRRAVLVTGIVWVVSGLGVWLIAPAGTVTIGASGIVFGWLTYLIVRGLFTRDVWQVLGGVVIALVYGGILWGVLPAASGVSWQGHLFGAAGGVLAAAVTSKTGKSKPGTSRTGTSKTGIDQGGFR